MGIYPGVRYLDPMVLLLDFVENSTVPASVYSPISTTPLCGLGEIESPSSMICISLVAGDV